MKQARRVDKNRSKGKDIAEVQVLIHGSIWSGLYIQGTALDTHAGELLESSKV